MAGVLASDDSMTGAPEKHPGDAVDQEAHSFVNSICTVSLHRLIKLQRGLRFLVSLTIRFELQLAASMATGQNPRGACSH